METTDFTFMQTGLTQLSNVDNVSHTEKATLLATLSVYLEEAIKIAEGIVIYEGRDQITDLDIILALKVQALDNQDIWDKPNTTTRIQDAFCEIYPSIANPTDVSSEDDVSNSSNNDIDDNCNVGTNELNSPTNKPELLANKAYHRIKTVPERWKSWVPQTHEQRILKNSIDKTEANVVLSE